MVKETILIRAGQIAARKLIKVMDKVEQLVLDSYAQQGNFRRVVGKNYKDITIEEMAKLVAIYQQPDGSLDPRFYQWIATSEIKLARKSQEEK